MSYIQPNSRIEFFDDIGISQDYNDTLYFETLEQKDNYFSTIDRLAHVDRCYYVRERRGFVRVELPMNTMIHAQYMRFQNTSYGLKWWYAFVTDVIYINDNTTEVQFEFDPMMSWMGEFSLSECYIERQHSETDEIGDNLVAEPVQLGTYVANFNQPTGYFTSWTYLVFLSPNVLGQIASAQDCSEYLGIYSGLAVLAYIDDGTAEAKLASLRVLAGVFGEVQMVAYVPSYFIPYIKDNPDFSDHQTPPVVLSHSITRSAIYNGLDGYGLNPNEAVRNNKLYTYPYNKLTVLNTEGDAHDYRFEYFTFSNNLINFDLVGSINEKSNIIMYPKNYKGYAINEEETLTMNDFPYATWTSDAFAAYLAQTLSSNPVSNLASATRSEKIPWQASDPAQTNFESGLGQTSIPISILTNVASNLGKAILRPNEVTGGYATDASVLYGKKDFYFVRKTINYESAKIIDNFFTMFGYAQKKIGVPNMNARQRFTFVKTIGCKINCRCPASDADFIESVFNRGIRFWKNHTDIGHYSIDNLPIGG